ncbi:hypothetical protein [Streptomyces nigrescens]|uniref:hypothetical protein n=1 Tax=Streptomyces nigrescens TaxID=1920 RepID=UPI0036FC0C25
MRDFDDPFNADALADYTEDNATYTTTLGELVTAAERESAAQRLVPGAGLPDPLVFEVDHDWVVHVTVPVDVVRELGGRHTHAGALEEEVRLGSDGLIVLGCGVRFVVVKSSDQLLSREEWEALVAKRNS